MKQYSFFRSSGYLSGSKIQTESGATLDLTSLPNFLRTLLVTDGTVTKSLEAWFWEEVTVVAVQNSIETTQEGMRENMLGLEETKGDKVLQREVILKGSHSNIVFAVASSTVLLKYLPDDVSLALEKGEIGIGELLREKGVETYRDIFNINYLENTIENKGLISKKLSGFLPPTSELLSRSYRIRVEGHPAIIVSEYFPVEIYR